MSTQQARQESPVELPIEPWLYEARPAPGCAVCAALMEQRAAASTDRERFALSAEIRDHRGH
ncbi:hypothetical protein ABT160_37440 [Streptomyces sp. NPDC001941]|uniref:hypothetical protein n=1 Tax=Streptomyces sp. NPDC001941 TaxID=3154659 RepID=UPI00332596B5